MKKLENTTMKIVKYIYHKILKKILLFLLIDWGKFDIFILNLK